MKKLILIIFFFLIISGVFWHFNYEKHGHTELAGARKSFAFFGQMRSYPESDIPETGILLAWENSKNLLNKTSMILPSWESIGPINVGGRTLAITLNPQNPNTIYAGSASGGLWRSKSGGVGPNAWEKINTGFPVLSVSSVAIAPDDSNVIYIGTGEVYGNDNTYPGITGDRSTRGSYGIGILKSLNGGLTWEKSMDWTLNQHRAVQMIKINQLRPATIWAATTEGTFRTNDAGDNWSLVHNVVMATDIEINPLDTNLVFIACGGMGSAGHGVYRTENNGIDWDKMLLLEESFNFGGKVRLAMSLSQPQVVYASVGQSSGHILTEESTATWLFRTLNDGDNWTLVSTEDYSLYQGWYSHDVEAHPLNPDEIWAVGTHFWPMFSQDGGITLQRADELGIFQADSTTVANELAGTWFDFHDIEYNLSNPDIIYFANDGGIYTTKDGGHTVINCNVGYQTTQFYNGTSSSFTDSSFILGGLQDNGTLAYDGYDFWRKVYGGDGSWTAINQSNNDSIFASRHWLDIVYSDNKGLDLAQIRPDVENSDVNFITPFVLSPVDNKTLYAGSRFIHITDNTDNVWTIGNSGEPLDGENAIICMAVSEQDVNRLYVATSPNVSRAKIFRSDNGAENWIDITRELPDLFITDIAVNPNDDDNLYITFGGFGGSHVYKSSDAGTTWQNIGNTLPDLPTWAVIVSPFSANEIFVGNEIGVYHSSDAGLTWSLHMAGLPEAVLAMDFTISRSNGKLRLATHGNGFYESMLPSFLSTNLEKGVQPIAFELSQNYPNPFNPITKIEYILKNKAFVKLTVFDLSGRIVRTLVDENQNSGKHSVAFDASGLSSGLYIYKLQSGSKTQSRKMIVAK